VPDRPAIPSETARKILIESGHRCAVCGAGCPLERAHIIPWHKSNEHRPEDLICLCANCHERADKEKWGERTLREYKNSPWVMRQFEKADSIPESKAQLHIEIDMELTHVDGVFLRLLQSGLAGFLEISPSDVRVISIEAGSMRVTIELPMLSAERLLRAYDRNAPELTKYLAPLVILDVRQKTIERERAPSQEPGPGAEMSERPELNSARRTNRKARLPAVTNRRMRFLVLMLVIWLFLFYNIERLSKPVDIAGVAYIFVPIVAALTISIPRLRQVPLWVLLGMSIPIFLVLKAWVGFPVWGMAMPLTVTEICVIAVTIILARWVSNGVGEFESAIAHITIGQVDLLVEPFSKSQAEMYREIRRARHHQRPLGLMAVGFEEKSIQVALDRMVQEVQLALMKRYVLSDVARVLSSLLEDYNVIALSNDHFLILLPEVTSEQLGDLVSRLRQAVSEQVGVTMQIGTASFPHDAVTFESLVEKAIGEMNGNLKQQHSLQPQRLATERHIT
jgi:hypothetical protein